MATHAKLIKVRFNTKGFEYMVRCFQEAELEATILVIAIRIYQQKQHNKKQMKKLGRGRIF